MSDFLVKKGDLRECRVTESEPPAIEAGQALLRVESFGMTANNVTYAVMGEAMSYWDFFPAAEGWGRVPVWGFATVERSEAGGVEEGTRIYGYLPPSSHLAVTPVSVEGGSFVDGSPHRAALPSAYHRYLATDADPFYAAATEDMQMLLRPLFFTSFLIDDQLADEGLAERGPIVISSASSKTAIAAAFLLARRQGVELVGLTSPGNAEFVAGLGIYDRTVAYDAIDSLERGPATYADFSGDAAVRQAVHSHYGDDLVHSMAVGVTHWEDFDGGGGELPGPTPTLFFAPTRVTKRAEDWGRARPRAAGRRGLAPLLRVGRGVAGGAARRGIRGGPERLPRRARGPGRPAHRARRLALIGSAAGRREDLARFVGDREKVGRGENRGAAADLEQMLVAREKGGVLALGQGDQIVVVGVSRAQRREPIGVGDDERLLAKEVDVLAHSVQVDVAAELLPAQYVLQLPQQEGRGD